MALDAGYLLIDNRPARKGQPKAQKICTFAMDWYMAY